MAKDLGGHASVFRNGDRNADVFQPLPAPVLQLQQRIRQALDPDRILNPGRLYKDL
jgi:glycolate oxidase FAD binding subunit